MNFASMTLKEVTRFAEYSARPALQQAARVELIRRHLGRITPPLTGWRLTEAMNNEPATGLV
jgi:hypothetical protein